MIVYLDDILVFSKIRDSHITHVNEVLERLKANNLWAKAEKCEFFQSEFHLLGYIASPNGIRMDPKKVESILFLANTTIRSRYPAISWIYHLLPSSHQWIREDHNTAHPVASKRRTFRMGQQRKSGLHVSGHCLHHHPNLATLSTRRPNSHRNRRFGFHHRWRLVASRRR